MEIKIDMNQDSYAQNRNRLEHQYKKNYHHINHIVYFSLGKCTTDDSKFGSNDDSQADDSDVTNKTSYSNLYQLFIGNLTWWTTDQDIMDSIINVGVHDIIDIQFFENRENGQSKGFCIVTLELEKSLNRILKKLPNELIYGRQPVVTFPSSSAYFMFESKSETRLSLSSIYQTISSMRDMSRNLNKKSLKIPSVGKPYHTRIPSISEYTKTHQQYPQNTRYKNQWNRSYQQKIGQMNQSYHCQAPVNPTIFNQTSVPLTYSQNYSYKDYHPSFTNYYRSHITNKTKMTETEINYIINRNRIVSSSAIARAITNATNGEYFSAIETLNEAIALIEDSKIANDDRSKTLVCTLYNTIRGIQTKVVKKKKELSKSPSCRSYRRSKREHS
ncbi:cleavage and polyadenylation specificity factor subunit CG7185-like [Melanaphis sacchari]|uniref:cleavage and polyadenylation specificity factor subunit CG7185-like n=1 Tax=Melanaphis sacchari TaxID=742174 RepID=UPI000DC12CDE|nr:cleavage and polyadenylation specificity factor subunit CG7185-like [Melanaphis sacchari]